MIVFSVFASVGRRAVGLYEFGSDRSLVGFVQISYNFLKFYLKFVQLFIFLRVVFLCVCLKLDC